MAYEIHDGLLQCVVAADMHLKSFERTLPTGLPLDELERGLDLLRSAIAEGRRIISDLRPSTLDDFGLVAAVRCHLARLQEQTSWAVSFEEELCGQPVPTSMETAIFRFVQEALSNAEQHAQSGRVAVYLGTSDGEIRLRIQDWGKGFDSEAIESTGQGLGLSAIQERVSLMGGSCRIESQPGHGTIVHVGLPIRMEV